MCDDVAIAPLQLVPLRAPVNDIAAPEFPRGLTWIGAEAINVAALDGRPLLVEFWDFCRPNSIRTLPYVRAWHERYAPGGLVVVGVHASGFDPSGDPRAVAGAVDRLGIPYAVAVDARYEIWREYGNEGWPARYLFGSDGMLVELHYGEGAYRETEQAIQELLGVEREPLAPLRPEDAPDAVLAPQTEDQSGPYSGPYEAGGVWAVLDGHGVVRANERELEVEHPGAYALIEHERHTAGALDLDIGAGVRCHGVCFTPGIA